MSIQKAATGLMALCLIMTTAMAPANAAYRRYDGYAQRHPVKSYFNQHPYVKKAAIGAGAGAVVGALVAPEGIRGSGAVKGALLGSAAGLGLQYLQNQGTFSNW